MGQDRRLRIGDVVARTGLTERALRHYEAEGLIAPERSPSGQRLYGAAHIAALATIDVLRRSGFSLAEIRALREGRQINLRALLRTQIEALRLEQAATASTIGVLEDLTARIEDGAEGDIDLLCSLVARGAACGPSPAWRAIFDKYFSAEQQTRWSALNERLAKAIDPAAYNQAWADLATDIKRALPLAPGSEAAQALLDRWNALLEPFRRVASETEQREAASFWSRVGDWGSAVATPVNGEVVAFIMAAQSARAEKKETQ